MSLFQYAAEHGDAMAQNYLGFMCDNGQGVSQDYRQAVQWYRKAADQGLANAQNNLGSMYAKGQGVTKDDQQAAEWYRKTADQGHAAAQSSLERLYEPLKVNALKNSPPTHGKVGCLLIGLLVIASFFIISILNQRASLEEGKTVAEEVVVEEQAPTETPVTNIEDGIEFYNQGNYDEAIKVFRPAAEQGDAKAQYNLGVMYFNGQGVQKDDQQAVQWYQKAADQGLADAETKLGWMYEKGQGVPKDYQQAEQWYRKAAEQGHAWGQFSLGSMYENGYGVGKDYKKAVEWYRKAAEQGHAWGQNRLGLMYENGYGVGKDYKKAVEWYRKAAEQGNDSGQLNLGSMYIIGQGVGKDYQKAVEWFRKAADQELADAQYNLGVMYANGRGVKKDNQQAVQWYRKAADQGLAEAQYTLGLIYAKGQGVQKDDQQAEQWFRKAAKQGYKDAIRALTGLAAEQGNAAAQYKVGLMFAKGEGVQQNYQQAEQWFRKAAKQGDKDAIRALKGMGAGVEVQQDNPADKAEPVKLASYKLGDRLPDGGIVFYIHASGKHGLAAQPADEYGAVTWHTARLLAGQNGSGWHLPTKVELGLLYPQKNVVGGFADEYYWSSTELDSSNAWYQSFIYGSQNNIPKGSSFRVRAVRAF